MTQSATLEFPPLVEPPAKTALAVASKSVVTIKDAAVAHLRAHEPTILALVERYRAVALTLDTPKGLAAGQAALTEVRENGRFAVQRARDATKDLLNGAKKDVETEATRLIALIQPTEEHIQAQIDARKAVLAAEKAERERVAAEAAQVEAERVARHRANIDRIRGYVAQAQCQPSGKIVDAIAFVCGLNFGPEYDEFADEAASTRDEVVIALNGLFRAAGDREEETARLEAQRVEQARIAAEQAEAQRRLDEQAAELKRRQDEIDRAEREAQAKRDAEAEAARIATLPPEPTAALATVEAIKAEVVEHTAPVDQLQQVVATLIAPPAAITAPVVTSSVTATEELMGLADEYHDALRSTSVAPARLALLTAVESLVAERDALRKAHQAIATLDHTRPLIDARSLARAALKGQP